MTEQSANQQPGALMTGATTAAGRRCDMSDTYQPSPSDRVRNR